MRLASPARALICSHLFWPPPATGADAGLAGAGLDAVLDAVLDDAAGADAGAAVGPGWQQVPGGYLLALSAASY